MDKLIETIFILIGWSALVFVTSYLWTAAKIMTDNKLTKHKKLCDICFRDIKRWHEKLEAAKHNNIKNKD